VKKTSIKRSMAQHNLTMLSKSRARKALGKCISNHKVSPKRKKANNTGSIKLTAKMHANINVARKLSAHRVGRHSDTG